MKTLILDDEQPAINILKGFVEKVAFLNLEFATDNPIDALDYVQNNEIDLLLLDIEMPDMNGVDFVRKLTSPPLIIFTTAYDHYAVEGFDLEVIDYLLKPIRFERFLKGVNRAKEKWTIEQGTKTDNEFIEIKSEYKNVRLAYKDILYIEGLKDYVKIHTKERTVLTRMNLKGIMSKLPSQRFIRLHRSFIINSAMIESHTRSFVVVGKKQIPIGKAFSDAFFNR
jgi:DNA-binding LytR/AlgR family response regulator